MEGFTLGNAIEIIFGSGILGFLFWIYKLNKNLSDTVWKRFDEHKEKTNEKINALAKATQKRMDENDNTVNKKIDTKIDKIFEAIEKKEIKSYERYVSQTTCKLVTAHNDQLFKDINNKLDVLAGDTKKLLSKNGYK